MGMGHAASSCWTATSEVVAKKCPKQFAKLIALLAQGSKTIEDLAQAIAWQNEVLDVDNNELTDNIELAYQALVDAWEKKTGLGISIGYHDRDSGDRYDDIYGVYWELDGVEELTPAGRKMQKHIQFSRWVTFG